MSRLFWIKIWTEEWLDGSIREQLSAIERSIWIDILVMAGRSRNQGIIQSNPNLAYSHEYLANRFRVKVEELEEALKHFMIQERVKETKKGIEIINWDKYQSEYKRTRKEYQKGTVHDKSGGF